MSELTRAANPAAAPNLARARTLLRGVQNTKRSCTHVVVLVDQAREACGLNHPLAQHLGQLVETYAERVTDHYAEYAAAGEPDPPRPNVTVTCADVGGDTECPLRGPIELSSRQWVQLPRLPWLQALQAVVNDADKPPAKTSPTKSPPQQEPNQSPDKK